MTSRNRPAPHQFGDNLDREKSRLEYLLATASEGDEQIAVKRKLYDIEAARTMNAWLSVNR